MTRLDVHDRASAEQAIREILDSNYIDAKGVISLGRDNSARQIQIALQREAGRSKIELLKHSMPFEEARVFLADYIDLQEEKDRAIEAHGKWGLIDAFIAAGIVVDEADYIARFNDLYLSKIEMTALRERLQAGEAWQALFTPGELDFETLWQCLFSTDGTDLKFSSLRTVKDDEFDTFADEMISAWRDSNIVLRYASTGDAPSPNRMARVLFTPKYDDVMPGRSGVDELKMIRKGVRFLDLEAELIRLRADFDREDERYNSNTRIHNLVAPKGNCSSVAYVSNWPGTNMLGIWTSAGFEISKDEWSGRLALG